MRIIDAECPELMETLEWESFETRQDIQDWLNGAPTLYNYVNINDQVAELKSKIPEALYDRVSEELLADQCCSVWIHCLECIEEMAETWKEVNGENLIWVPGHYECKPEIDSMNYSFDSTHVHIKHKEVKNKWMQ